ncbi:MAG: hypothetical protein LKG11_02800 [Bacilli bacterium]|jgi:hypothetical protein|nr:hypothetical protein [Bacilli bacterium]
MLEELRQVLLQVNSKVFYAANEYDNDSVTEPPFIIYQETTKRAGLFNDNKPAFYVSDIQITLVTKKKDPDLEHVLESTLLQNDYTFEVLSEYRNPDGSINRVYEIRLEEYINAKQ